MKPTISKIWGGFNLTFLKVKKKKKKNYRESKFLQSDLTINLLLPPLVTY